MERVLGVSFWSAPASHADQIGLAVRRGIAAFGFSFRRSYSLREHRVLATADGSLIAYSEYDPPKEIAVKPEAVVYLHGYIKKHSYRRSGLCLSLKNNIARHFALHAQETELAGAPLTVSSRPRRG